MGMITDEALKAGQRTEPRYGVWNDTGDGPRLYYLTRDGEVVETRMRRFKRAYWFTRAGAQAAADALNDADAG